MQIALNQAEIEAGIKMYIESRGISLSDRKIVMDFTAVRKGNAGINVDVDLGEDAHFHPTEKHSNVAVIRTQSGGVSARRSQAADVLDIKGSQVSKPEPEPEPPIDDEPLNEQLPPEETPAPKKRTRRTKAEMAESLEKESSEEPVAEEAANDAQAEEPTKVESSSNLFASPTPSAEKPVAEPVSPGIPDAQPEPRQSLFG
ncbi:hypothetical protein [Vreelandella venusta]|uniref:hypothetical protein n=1 Tax=Vreelandella venusta TaxID=44935 RepID=UPI0011755DDF|nr:hypothetical protein [Halomonas venusta]GEK52344.1 hypothetical protein HVE01_30650 [Halomonas venusta]